jgi:hypothetical protein
MYMISSFKQKFRTFYIPNLIPVIIVFLDLNLLRQNSLHILNFILN